MLNIGRWRVSLTTIIFVYMHLIFESFYWGAVGFGLSGRQRPLTGGKKASAMIHPLLLKRYMTANSPAIANTASKPGSLAGGGGVGTTAILTVSLIKPLDPADITAIPETLDVNSVDDKFVPAGMTIEEFTYPRVAERFTWMSASVTTGSPSSANSLTVTVDVPPTVTVDGSAVKASWMGMELRADTGMTKINASNISTKITTIFLFFIIFISTIIDPEYSLQSQSPYNSYQKCTKRRSNRQAANINKRFKRCAEAK